MEAIFDFDKMSFKCQKIFLWFFNQNRLHYVRKRLKSTSGNLQDLLENLPQPYYNPFNYQIYKHGPGTKDKPNVIPSIYESRIIGCICEENSTDINFMELHKGEPKRCECGYWFKLEEDNKKKI